MKTVKSHIIDNSHVLHSFADEISKVRVTFLLHNTGKSLIMLSDYPDAPNKIGVFEECSHYDIGVLSGQVRKKRYPHNKDWQK